MLDLVYWLPRRLLWGVEMMLLILDGVAGRLKRLTKTAVDIFASAVEVMLHLFDRLGCPI